MAISPANETRDNWAAYKGLYDSPNQYVMAWSWDALPYKCHSATGPCTFRATSTQAGYQCPYGWDPAHIREIGYGYMATIYNGGNSNFTRTSTWVANTEDFNHQNGSWAMFTYQNASSHQRWQVWANTPATLQQKYQWAGANGLKGVGIFTLDSIEIAPGKTNSGPVSDRNALWGALDRYLHTYPPGQHPAGGSPPGPVASQGSGWKAMSVIVLLLLLATCGVLAWLGNKTGVMPLPCCPDMSGSRRTTGESSSGAGAGAGPKDGLTGGYGSA